MGEISEQAEVWWWFWNAFPSERRLYHGNNNNSHDKKEGAKNKSLGVVPGRSDFEYFKRGVLYCIEFKTLKGNSIQSKDQIKFEEKIKSEGGIYIIVRTVKEAKELLENIMIGIYLP